MRCPVDGRPCSKHKAHAVVSNVGGEEKNHLVCEDCLSLNQNIQPVDEPGLCPSCGSTLDQIVRTSRLGCVACYDHFGDALSYIIAAVQFGSDRHVGAAPDSFKRSRAESADPAGLAAEMEEEMGAAARSDDYARASRLKGFLSDLGPILGVLKEKGELGPDERAEVARIAYEYMYPDSAQGLHQP